MTNDDLSQIVETSDEWIQSRTGIRERRISEGADTAELAAGAAKAALENAGVSADDVDLILVATSTPGSLLSKRGVYGPGSYWCGTGGGL